MSDDNIVPFKKDEEDPHATGKAFCMQCKNEWIGVAPIGAVELECPKCGTMKGRFKFEHDRPEEEVWTCYCENNLMYITPKGVYCPNCGLWQEGF